MTYNEFQNQSDNEKISYIWHNGKPVARSFSSESSFILYQLDGFYVEIEYKTDFVEIVKLNAFGILDIPAAYLDQVDITGLQH